MLVDKDKAGDSSCIRVESSKPFLYKAEMEDRNETQISEARRLEEWAGKECNMCGDVGFHEELFKCTKCQVRYQHTYCSMMYPDLVVDHQWICDWCSHVGSTIAVKHQTRMKIRKENKHSFKAQWSKSSDALELLLAVAQSILRGKLAADHASAHQQVVMQKQDLRKQRSALKKKRKLGIDDLNPLSKDGLRLTTSSKGIVRRYKLLSDF